MNEVYIKTQDLSIGNLFWNKDLITIKDLVDYIEYLLAEIDRLQESRGNNGEV